MTWLHWLGLGLGMSLLFGLGLVLMVWNSNRLARQEGTLRPRSVAVMSYGVQHDAHVWAHFAYLQQEYARNAGKREAEARQQKLEAGDIKKRQEDALLAYARLPLERDGRRMVRKISDRDMPALMGISDKRFYDLLHEAEHFIELERRKDEPIPVYEPPPVMV